MITSTEFGADTNVFKSIGSLLTQSLALTSGLFSSLANDEGIVKKPIVLDNGMTCPIDLPLSCMNDTSVADLCCFEYPGGVILLTQFWDYSPATGAKDEFTMHGLWPDNCDGSFEQFCDKSLEIYNPGEIVKLHDEELFNEMSHFWKDNRGNDEHFWTHEYNKHGTCYTTIKPSCYGEENYKNRVDVYDFFKAAVELHKTLPTYKFLTDEGIVPSYTETYTKTQILDALKKNFGGFEPFVKCDRSNAINEIWYFHHLQGNLKNGKFNRIDTFNSFACKEEGIHFFPKSNKVIRPTKTLMPPHPRPTGDYSKIGFLKLTNEPGCLIKNGKWYSSGTCATFKMFKKDDGKIFLKSNGGYCGLVDNDKFLCAQGMQATEFNYDEESGVLSTDKENGDIWSADRVPSGRTQVDVKNVIGGEIEFKLHFESRY